MSRDHCCFLFIFFPTGSLLSIMGTNKEWKVLYFSSRDLSPRIIASRLSKYPHNSYKLYLGVGSCNKAFMYALNSLYVFDQNALSTDQYYSACVIAVSYSKSCNAQRLRPERVFK